MIKEKQALINFMVKKSWLLGFSSYFTSEDAEAIQEWGDNNAKEVHTFILNGLKCGETKDKNLCPFCVHYDENAYDTDCYLCKYASHHGRCGKDLKNDYDSILDNLRTPSLSDYFDTNVEDWRELLIKELES